ncbi:unnamed protein product [Trichogramma brassicae]|uniref:Uncharacterized protein n=1 Tax=Trichogramma brassicae TaxID=86971 RepID=A0A6H5IQ02_9HYME|nr:unnamed protein product [Trichogramma brassicae]
MLTRVARTQMKSYIRAFRGATSAPCVRRAARQSVSRTNSSQKDLRDEESPLVKSPVIALLAIIFWKSSIPAPGSSSPRARPTSKLCTVSTRLNYPMIIIDDRRRQLFHRCIRWRALVLRIAWTYCDDWTQCIMHRRAVRVTRHRSEPHSKLSVVIYEGEVLLSWNMRLGTQTSLGLYRITLTKRPSGAAGRHFCRGTWLIRRLRENFTSQEDFAYVYNYQEGEAGDRERVRELRGKITSIRRCIHVYARAACNIDHFLAETLETRSFSLYKRKETIILYRKRKSSPREALNSFVKFDGRRRWLGAGSHSSTTPPPPPPSWIALNSCADE